MNNWYIAKKCNHCLSTRFLRLSQNWKQKLPEKHNPQQINLLLRHWLKHYKLKWNEMHGHSAAKCYHCLSKRFLRTSQNWKQKSSERRDPQQINLMQGHWLKRYKLKRDEMHRVSYKMLSLFVKEIPTDITKLETKIIKYSIHNKSISCRHN